jgi:hypothetical protein
MTDASRYLSQFDTGADGLQSLLKYILTPWMKKAASRYGKVIISYETVILLMFL